jgi:flavodoxin
MTTKKTIEEKSKSAGGFKERRENCINELHNVKGMDFKGKDYLTVALRHNHLLSYFPEARIEEEIIFHDNERVVCKTILYIGETPYSTGHAEEKRNANFINKTSALENAATSSLGRCLATFGLHGTEFSSADELANAVINQKDSIKEKIKKTTNQTKLTKLFSDWKKDNDSIEELFNQQEQTIHKEGGQNVKSEW